jgi:hypothetical protein
VAAALTYLCIAESNPCLRLLENVATRPIEIVNTLARCASFTGPEYVTSKPNFSEQ